MASKDTPKTILLGGCHGLQREGKAGGAITPGMLLNIRALAAVVAHNEAGQECQAAFAIENDFVGKGISDAYANGEQVRYGVLPDGERVYALVAASQNIALGDLLTSNGDGMLKEAGATDFVIGIARSVLVTGVGVTGRIILEIAKGRGIA